jgi:phospholipid transport system substrate-binding protein
MAGAALLIVAVATLPDSNAPAARADPASSAPQTPRAAPVAQTPAEAVAAAAVTFESAIAAARMAAEPDPAALRQALKPLLEHLDLQRATRLLLGRHWHTARESERRAVQDALVKFLLIRHAPALRDLQDWQLTLLPGRPPTGDLARVPVAVGARGLPEVRIDLHLSRRDGRWRLYDATLSGIGLIGLQRPVFTALAAEHGLDGLIAALGR